MLIGDFNIYLLKHDTNVESIIFVDPMYTMFFLPYITTPTWVTTYAKTPNDKIALKNIEDGLISENWF